MGRLGHAPDQQRVAFIAFAVASLQHPLLEERLQVVEHQQAAPLLQELDQERQRLLAPLRQARGALLRNEGDPVEQDVVQGRGVVQRAPQHAVEVGRHLLGEFDRQGGFADAAHAQHSHQATALAQQPTFKLGQFVAAAVDGRHVERFTPVSPQQARGSLRRIAAPGPPLLEQGGKPRLIEVADAVGGTLAQLPPERAAFLLLLPGRKPVFVEVELDQLLQVEFGGIVTARFPVANALLRHTHPQRHFFLGQSGALAQGHQQLGEVKVPRFVVMMITHGSPLPTRACIKYPAKAKHTRDNWRKTATSGNKRK